MKKIVISKSSSTEQSTSVNKKTKGMTLVETIVSMALILIVSLVAFLVLNSSFVSIQKNKEKSFFICQTQNIIMAYNMGESDFEKSLKLMTGKNFVYGQNTTIYFDKDFQITNQEDSKYKVDLVFNESRFSVKCSNQANNIIYKAEV